VLGLPACPAIASQRGRKLSREGRSLVFGVYSLLWTLNIGHWTFRRIPRADPSPVNTLLLISLKVAQTIACSVALAERDLGYLPQVSLEEGMRRSLKWCVERGIKI
jgi:hypothetical protein